LAPGKGVEQARTARQVADNAQLGTNGVDLAVKQIFRTSSLFLQKLAIGLQAREVAPTVGEKCDFLNSLGGATCRAPANDSGHTPAHATAGDAVGSSPSWYVNGNNLSSRPLKRMSSANSCSVCSTAEGNLATRMPGGGQGFSGPFRKANRPLHLWKARLLQIETSSANAQHPLLKCWSTPRMPSVPVETVKNCEETVTLRVGIAMWIPGPWV
jgi:hypothetical protein